jgi:hypothetical protein
MISDIVEHDCKLISVVAASTMQAIIVKSANSAWSPLDVGFQALKVVGVQKDQLALCGWR